MKRAFLLFVLMLALAPRVHAGGAGGASAGVGGAGGVGGFATGGNSASPVPLPMIASTHPIPANGAVLFIDSFGLGAMLLITSPSGTRVEGSYVQIDATYWAFRPSVPFVPGTYLVESTDGPPSFVPNGSFITSFTVVEAVDLSTPVLMSDPSLSLVSETLQPSWCCDLWTDFGVQGGACTPASQATYAQLDLGLSSSTGVIALDQFLFTLRTPDGSHYGYGPWAGGARSMTFLQGADEYCFDLQSIAIFDSSVHSFDALERCVPHGDLGELGTTILEPPPSFYDRARCTEPPDGMDEAWCELNADCAGNDDVDCVLYGHLCEGDERPLWRPPSDHLGAGTGAIGGGGGLGGSAGTRTGGVGGAGGGQGGAAGMLPLTEAGGAADADMREAERGDCSVTSPGRRTPSSGAWLALLALRRRKRSA